MRFDSFFRLCVIIGSLPNNIQNGQVADANPLMADLNWIVNQVNANAAPIAGVALLQGNNTWSGTQTFQAPVTFLSGAAATANTVSTVPNAGQVQSWAFNTLSSVASLAGTNSYRGIAPLQASVLSIGQIWTFITSSPNNGPAQLGINSIASRQILKYGLGSSAPIVQTLSSGDIVPNNTHLLATNSTSFQLLNPGPSIVPWVPVDGSGASLSIGISGAEWWQNGLGIQAEFAITYPANSSGAAAQINGLPFNVPNRTSAGGGFVWFNTSGIAISPVGVAGNPSFNFRNSATGAGISNTQMSGVVVRGMVIYPIS